MKICRRKRCSYCKKVRKCARIGGGDLICLECYNEGFYNNHCKVCTRLGKYCKRHKIKNFDIEVQRIKAEGKK